jgi:hypothetical protein
VKNTVALVAVIVAALGSSAFTTGCSSAPAKEDVDTGTALAALRAPTGSFSEKSAGKAFGGYRADRTKSSKVATPGTTPTAAGKTGTQSIRLLDRATSSAACGQGQSCACPNGGAMRYEGSSTADGTLVKVTFDACVFEDGWGFDGKAAALASNKSLLGIVQEPAATPSATPAAGDGTGTAAGGGFVALLVAAKGTITDGKNELPLEVALVTEAHYTFLAVSVPDGKIVIGVSDDGRAIVKSKEGTWTCKSTAGSWSCTSDSGQSMEVAEEAPSEPVPTASTDTPAPAQPSAPASP